ncbi:32 kDa beta-galactoside-binding lectin-like [Topomyia yanbarensis]|uniref:32 kDa beta-galactoside-binding lectin-like n=1 Tax=Topomyia yanbarensis TaxID=2498891 RepID=UPI00273AF3C8|nr:32 kDa beta-galactoside-binding lectin-like [Topomyia yanbarensis]
MAVLAYLLLSVGDDLVEIAEVFIRSGGSFAECREYLQCKKQEQLFRYYLAQYSKEVHNEAVKMSTESLDSCDYAYQDSPQSPGSISLDKSSSTEIVYTLENITEVSAGLSFVISGSILLTCERFSINFMLKNSDLALHFNPRLPQNYIVRNCRIKGVWGKEEVASPLSFNLHRGQKFKIQILVSDKEFLICVNGRHFNAFKHRLPYKKICALEVKGDVKDVAVEQIYIENYPDIVLDEIAQISRETFALGDILDSNYKIMPYTGRLAQPFTNGKNLHIRGRIKLLPHSFYVNLQSNHYCWPHPNVQFHLNPRFGSVGGKHVICRNSWIDGKWDREERSENLTDFMPGKLFHLKIACTDVSYQVYLNEKLIAEFVFREDPKLVETIYIQGDIKVFDVVLESAY